MSDTLRSTSYMRIIDLLCEGPIEGLATASLQSVLLDETPMQAADGTINHQGVSTTFAWGLSTVGPLHPAMVGMNSTDSLQSVGVELKENVPIVRTISNTAVDAVRIVITVPSLSRTDRATGDIEGTSVSIRVQVQPSGGTWMPTDGDIIIRGRTQSQYQRQKTISLADFGPGPWSIRMIRMTDDSDSAYLQNKTYWSGYTEIIDEKLYFPWSVMCSMSIDAEKFSSVPSRAWVVKGLKVQIPSNYNPVTRVYTGTWDGTFKPAKAWTDNPAWCLYDLLTSKRYGLGRFVGSGVDKWSLYQIGRYCDGLVPDGFGGTEPRFRCNIALTSRAEAYRVVQDMASIFQGMVFWASGTITATQDAPADPVALYTPANVIDGAFTYSGSSAKARHTAALVTWNDPADLHRQKVEYVEDPAGIARYGLIITELAAVGCTSRGQAHRVGKWLLYSERMQSETVSFKAGLDTLYCRPGQVIKVADPARAGVRLGGRVISATTTSVQLDAPVTLEPGSTYTLSVMRSDLTVMSSTVTTASSTVSTVTVAPALAEAPAPGAIWVLASASVDAQLFRVLSVAETDPGIFEVTALAHEPTKYASVEQGVKLQTRSISALRAIPQAPLNLVVTEALYARGAVLATRLDVSWTLPDGANAALVSWRRSDGASSPESQVYEAGIEIDAAQEGQTYVFTVYAINPLGVRSVEAATVTHTVQGKLAPPSGVSGFVVARTKDQLSFTWRPITDLDADLYEIRLGESWDTAVIVGSAPHPTNALQITSPRGGTYMIKARDTSGGYSTVPSIVVAPDILGINVVVTQDEASSGFPGARVDTTTYSIAGTPAWDGLATWGSTTTWDANVIKTGLTLTAGATAGTYTSQPLDIGIEAYTLISLDALTETLGAMSLPWDAYTAPWSAYTAPWAAAGGTITAAYEVRTTTDGLTWTPWSVFLPGVYSFRLIQVRVTLGTTDPAVRPFLTKLTLNVDVPDRRISLADVAVPSTGKVITFTPAFVDVQTVQVTLQDASPGDNATVTSKSPGSIAVQIYNAAGAPVAGVLDIDVFGYGERY